MPPENVQELLADAPRNWGRWGSDDEVGCLNFQSPEEVLRGARHIRSGKVFTLGIPMARPEGDPVWPGVGRSGAVRLNTQDRSDYVAGKRQQNPGGAEFADDYMTSFPQGSTQYDAIGHMWAGDKIYNGHDAMSTAGSLAKCGVDGIAQRGVVGRGILVDIARHRGKDALEPGELITLEDIQAALDAQGVTVEKHDNLLLRTGWLGTFYSGDQRKFYGGGEGGTFHEPGLYYTPELVQWFYDSEFVSYSTDTLGNETTYDPNTGWVGTLHIALLHGLGLLFSEMNALDALAADCADDGQYTFLYCTAPLNIANGAGAPVNPVVVK
jgi:kynurenine formamidase